MGVRFSKGESSGLEVVAYRFVLPLGQDLCDRIQAFKEQHLSQHQSRGDHVFKGLTLAYGNSFFANEAALSRFIKILSAENSFQVSFENFAAYPSHTVYLSVDGGPGWRHLTKKIRKLRSMFNVNELELSICEPQYILAQGLNPREFESLWSACAGAHFSGKFLAENLQLWRRRNGDRYRLIDTIPFLSQPKAVVQPNLF